MHVWMILSLLLTTVGLANPLFAQENNSPLQESAAVNINNRPQEFILKNGLKLIVKEDHRAPVVVSMIWYRVGSSDESGGKTGISHVLEHLMFKGTKKYPMGVFSKTIASLGGQENAFTNNDYTAYFEKSSAANLATSFNLEADRMENLQFDANAFAKEMKVIQEERRLRTDDNPQALTFERFLATAHLSSPYNHPVIGWMSDLQNMTSKDAKEWYKKYYIPNNAILIVVGDVKAREVYTLAQRYFGPIKPGEPIARPQQTEPPNLGKKSVDVHASAKIPMLMVGYTVPTVANAKNALDPYTLEIIASILSAGDSSRLNKQLIREKEVASSIDTYYNLYARFETQFIIFGTPSRSHSLEDLEKNILAVIKELQTHPISDQELQRVKKQIIAQKTFEKDSIFEQAMELGVLETADLGWPLSEQYINRINQVTPAHLQHVAQQYLQESKITVAKLIPLESPS